MTVFIFLNAILMRKFRKRTKIFFVSATKPGIAESWCLANNLFALQEEALDHFSKIHLVINFS